CGLKRQTRAQAKPNAASRRKRGIGSMSGNSRNTAAGLKAAAASDVDEITGHRRMRRTRVADWSRRLTRETRLTVDDLIWPIFIVPGTNITEPIAAMPGVSRMSVDRAVEAARMAADLGIPALATFPNVR